VGAGIQPAATFAQIDEEDTLLTLKEPRHLKKKRDEPAGEGGNSRRSRSWSEGVGQEGRVSRSWGRWGGAAKVKLEAMLTANQEERKQKAGSAVAAREGEAVAHVTHRHRACA
jgi:hypothetical protein